MRTINQSLYQKFRNITEQPEQEFIKVFDFEIKAILF